MAKISKRFIFGGKEALKVKFMNISDSVGVGGVNSLDDVILVQALFKISEEQLSNKLKVPKPFPYPTGAYNEQTENLIFEFQLRNSWDVKGKWLICPAKGLFKPGTRELWTIHLLDDYLLDSATLISKDKFEAMYDKFPNTLFLFRE